MIVVIQAWIIAGMNRKINELKTGSDNTRSRADIVTPQPKVTSPQMLLRPKFAPQLVPPKIAPKTPYLSKNLSTLILCYHLYITVTML